MAAADTAAVAAVADHCESRGRRVVVADFPAHGGKQLRAGRDYLANQIVFAESPLFSVPHRLCHPGIPTLQYLFSAYTLFTALPTARQTDILGLFSPTDGAVAKSFRTAANDLGLLPDAAAIDEFVQFAMALHFNSVDCQSTVSEPDHEATGRALFAMACRMSHSCDPSCVWFTDGVGRRIVRARRSIARDEALTVDYLGETASLSSTSVRQALLRRKYEFDCQCPRCSAEGDATRGFPCVRRSWPSPADAVPACQGLHLAESRTMSSQQRLLPCFTCRCPVTDECANECASHALVLMCVHICVCVCVFVSA
jgi:hypothetical protein